MAIKVLEIHHHAVRVDGDDDKLKNVQNFYSDVLGMGHDTGRPHLPGIPGMWINVGEVGQLHLIGGDLPSPFAQGPGQDPTAPHVALAVADIVEARAELEQLFVNDPCGNMVELHQIDKCRCRADSRRKI